MSVLQVIDVPACKVTMFGTKVEIKLKKAEPGKWSKVEANIIKKTETPKKQLAQSDVIASKIEAVDLSDL